MAQSNSRTLVILLLSSGFFMTGLFFDYLPSIIDSKIKTTVELATNQEILSLWSKPPVEFDTYYWLYDVLNVDGFMAGEKIQVRKVGPYHFTSTMEKKIIDLSQNKYRITYNTSRHFELRDQQTQAALEEQLHVLNPIYASMLESTRFTAGQMDPLMKGSIYASASKTMDRFNETLIMNLTARQVILGRAVPFLKKIRKLIETFGIDIKLPNIVDGDVFGFIALQNNTWSGPFEIYTGYQASMPSLGEIISFQGKRRLTEYQGRCNRIQTSAGELYPMPLKSNQTLEFFRPEFCRIVRLKPNFERKSREGIVIGYSFLEDDFKSAQDNQENKCYCQLNSLNSTKDNYCSLNGVIELAPCSYYSPILISLNNLDIDQRIKSTIGNWDQDLRDSSLDPLAPPDKDGQFLILKRMGFPINGDITLNLFMKVTRDPSFKQTANLPEVSYVPLVMIREMASIPAKWARLLANLESMMSLSHHIRVVMYLSSFVLLCWLTSHYYGRSGVSGERVIPFAGAGNGSANGRGGSSAGSNSNSNSGANGSQANQRAPSGSQKGGGERELASSEGTGSRRRQSTAPKAATADTSPKPKSSLEGELEIGGQGRLIKSVKVGLDQSELERSVNSVDSIRSLPPSRMSRSSLESASVIGVAGCGGAEREQQLALNLANFANCAPPTGTSADGLAMIANERSSGKISLNEFKQFEKTSADEQRQQPSNRDVNLAKKSAGAIEALDQWGASTAAADPLMPPPSSDAAATNNSHSSALIFSKVDQLRWNQNNNNNKNKATPTSPARADLSGRRQSSQGARKDSMKTQLASNGTSANRLAPSSIEDATCNDKLQDDDNNQQQQKSRLVLVAASLPVEGVKRSKAWFMRVCSNFVRMLNDIRTTITDAGQLDVSENNNDYQDKQLEMLAGKIDNWYAGMSSERNLGSQAGQAPPPASIGPVSPEAGAEAAAATGPASINQMNSFKNPQVRGSPEEVSSSAENSDGGRLTGQQQEAASQARAQAGQQQTLRRSSGGTNTEISWSSGGRGSNTAPPDFNDPGGGLVGGAKGNKQGQQSGKPFLGGLEEEGVTAVAKDEKMAAPSGDLPEQQQQQQQEQRLMAPAKSESQNEKLLRVGVSVDGKEGGHLGNVGDEGPARAVVDTSSDSIHDAAANPTKIDGDKKKEMNNGLDTDTTATNSRRKSPSMSISSSNSNSNSNSNSTFRQHDGGAAAQANGSRSDGGLHDDESGDAINKTPSNQATKDVTMNKLSSPSQTILDDLDELPPSKRQLNNNTNANHHDHGKDQNNSKESSQSTTAEETTIGQSQANSGALKAETIESNEQQTNTLADNNNGKSNSHSGGNQGNDDGSGAGGAGGASADSADGATTIQANSLAPNENRNNNSSLYQSNKTIISNHYNSSNNNSNNNNNNNNNNDNGNVNNNTSDTTSLDECETFDGSTFKDISDDKATALEQIEQALAKQNHNQQQQQSLTNDINSTNITNATADINSNINTTTVTADANLNNDGLASGANNYDYGDQDDNHNRPAATAEGAGLNSDAFNNDEHEIDAPEAGGGRGSGGLSAASADSADIGSKFSSPLSSSSSSYNNSKELAPPLSILASTTKKTSNIPSTTVDNSPTTNRYNSMGSVPIRPLLAMNKKLLAH